MKHITMRKYLQMQDDILHHRFRNEEDLGKYIAKLFGADKVNNLTLDNQSDFEEEKFDFDYIGTVIKNGEEIADVFVWVLYDRKNQLYVTEFEFEYIV